MTIVVRLVAAALCLLPVLAAAAAPVPPPPQVAARAWLLVDAHSGRVLAEKNADQRMEPASLTKLMTAYAVFHELKNGSVTLDEPVLVSKKAWKMGGSRMFIEVGKRVPVKELLLGMIVQSGNDASIALAEHIGGSEEAFVALMNEHARALGMDNTHFANATGWPHKDHYSTARDLARLTRALITEFPEYYKWYRIKEYTYNGIRQSNRNRLLWLDDRVDGVKTGHTESAGYCLITSAVKGDMRLISVVLGTRSEEARVSVSRALLNYGFRFYDTVRLYAAGEELTRMRAWKGEPGELPLGLAEDLYVTLPRGQRKRLKAHMQVDRLIEAPIEKGRAYGMVQVKVGDEVVAERPLVALMDVPAGGLWRRMVDSIVLLFQ